MQLVKWIIQFLLGLCSILRVDLFATYAYSCHIFPLELFIVFRPKFNEKFHWANATVVRVCCK